MYRPVIVCLLVALAGSARADKPEAGLDAARQTYADAVEKARKQLLDALTAAAKAAMTSGNLDVLKMIQAEKEEFEKNGKLPASARMKTAVQSYHQATKQAAAALEKAYENTVRDLTKAGKITQAEAVQEELKKFRAANAPPHPPARPAVEAPGREELQKFLCDTTWTLDGGIKFKADGSIHQKTWEALGLSTKWEVVDRRTVVILVEKGRPTNRTAVLVFSEDLSEFRGFLFDGSKMPAQQRQKP
jgi:hypothetical protein